MNSHGRCPNLWAYIRLNEPSSEGIKDLCAQSRSLFSTSRCLRLLQLLSTLNLEFSPAWGGGGGGGGGIEVLGPGWKVLKQTGALLSVWILYCLHAGFIPGVRRGQKLSFTNWTLTSRFDHFHPRRARLSGRTWSENKGSTVRLRLYESKKSPVG